MEYFTEQRYHQPAVPGKEVTRMEAACLSHEDVESILSLIEEDVHLLAGSFPFRAMARNQVAALLRDEGTVYLSRDEGGAPTGFLWVDVRDDVLFVRIIAVEKAHRRDGLGRTLLAELFDEACRRDMRAVGLEVAPDNSPMVNLITSMGFEPCSRTREGTYFELAVPGALP